MDKVERPMWSRVGLRYTTNIDGPKFESPERGELERGEPRVNEGGVDARHQRGGSRRSSPNGGVCDAELEPLERDEAWRT
jgi:hypothetical protein